VKSLCEVAECSDMENKKKWAGCSALLETRQWDVEILIYIYIRRSSFDRFF
jgi:hypothetical protein